jgi:hypothetical protein
MPTVNAQNIAVKTDSDIAVVDLHRYEIGTENFHGFLSLLLM